MRPRYGIIALCFFLSGATGLVYQVVWLRMLGLVFGHTVHAITTVLAAFMAGLALGSFLFARRAARIRDLVRAYGWMEIGIGLYCAAIPLLFSLASIGYLWLHGALGLSFTAFTALQFALIGGVLLVPTTLMGGTLPVLSQALARDDRGLGRTISLLYGINTLGAVAGTVAAGYFVLPALGNHRTVAVAAAANLVVGALAIASARWSAVKEPARARAEPQAPEPTSTAPPERSPVEHGRVAEEALPAAVRQAGLGVWLTVVALGVSGAVSMVYEVAWTRALALVLGSSTYAFTSMLVAFLVGIAGGSALYGWLWGARHATPAVFAILQLATGLAAAGVVAGFHWLPEIFLAGLSAGNSPTAVQSLQLAISACALLTFTVFIGATFPCAITVVAPSARRAGRDIGHVYAINTLGAIAGSVLAGFALVPAFGVQGSIKLAIAVNLTLAAVLFAASTEWRLGRGLAAAAAMASALGVFALPPWDPGVMTSGPAIYGARLLDLVKRGGQATLFYRDGPTATVSVHRSGEALRLTVNGKTDASSTGDMPTQLLSGHVPMLVHPDARRVLVIGLGSGVTAGAVARHPIERMDIVEIEPAVVQANRFFADLNGHVLQDPRVQVLVADGRNVLLTARERYDVIISEPSNPWISGVASLFTAEFFHLARERLRPGGIMLQWIQLYGLSPEDLRLVVRSFRTAFPVSTAWEGAPGDVLLLGQTDAGPLDVGALRRRFDTQPVAEDLRRIGIADWAEVLGYFVLARTELARFAGEGGLNTDDRLSLEFSAPRALYLNTIPLNLGNLRRAADAHVPEVSAVEQPLVTSADFLYRVARNSLGRGANTKGLALLERALQANPQHIPALLAASDANLAPRPAIALQFAERAVRQAPTNAAALHSAALALMQLYRSDEAIPLLKRAVEIEPGRRDYRETLSRAARSVP